ncbi:MAG TPA: hypothetical protein VLB27_12310 [candidate division Zixibacteria bacterium]|nr:hypothetical protein [candidate division Zixibacteria bacterium]
MRPGPLTYVRWLCAILAWGVWPFAQSSARTEERYKLPVSDSVVVCGGLSGSFYLREGGEVRQFDGLGRERRAWTLESSQRFTSSPEGFYFALSGVRSDSSVGDSLPERWSAGFEVFERTGDVSARIPAPEGASLFINDDGRSVLLERRGASGTELWVFDRDGSRMGYCHVRKCDTVIFAPEERGFAALSYGASVQYFRYTGDKVATYPQAELFVFSSDGRRQLSVSKGRATVYRDSETLRSFSLPRASVMKVIFDSVNDRLYVLTKKRLYAIRVGTGATLLDYPTLGEDHFFTDLGYNAKLQQLVVCAAMSAGAQFDESSRRMQSWVRILTPEGKEEQLFYVINNRPAPGLPRVYVDPAEPATLFLTPDYLHKVRW